MRLPLPLALVWMATACTSDSSSEGSLGSLGLVEDVPHTDVPHVNHPPAGDGVPNPAAPVEPPPGVDPPPTTGRPPDPTVSTSSDTLPGGLLLLQEPDPGWSSLPASERVTLRGTVYTLDRGQVRLSARVDGTWETVEIASVEKGKFVVAVPKAWATPLYVSVSSDAHGDGPTHDDPAGGREEPVVFGGADAEISVRVGQLPDWTRELPTAVQAVLTRGTVAP